MTLPKYDRSYPRMKRGKGGRKEGRKDKEEPDQIADRQISSPTHHQDLRIVPLHPANYRKLARVRLAPNQLSIITSLLIQRLSPLFPKQEGKKVECARSNGSARQDMHVSPSPTPSALQAIEHRKHFIHFMIKSTRTDNLGTKKKGNRKQRYITFVNEFPYHERCCFFLFTQLLYKSDKS